MDDSNAATSIYVAFSEREGIGKFSFHLATRVIVYHT